MTFDELGHLSPKSLPNVARDRSSAPRGAIHPRSTNPDGVLPTASRPLDTWRCAPARASRTIGHTPSRRHSCSSCFRSPIQGVWKQLTQACNDKGFSRPNPTTSGTRAPKKSRLARVSNARWSRSRDGLEGRMLRIVPGGGYEHDTKVCGRYGNAMSPGNTTTPFRTRQKHLRGGGCQSLNGAATDSVAECLRGGQLPHCRNQLQWGRISDGRLSRQEA